MGRETFFMQSGNYSGGISSHLKSRRLTTVSILIALALVIRFFSIMIFFGGAGGLRISFTHVFTRLVAILFGPFTGGLASGIVDLLGYILKPEGAFIPLLTVSAILCGMLAGLIWHLTGGMSLKRVRVPYILAFSLIGLMGLFNWLMTIWAPESPWSKLIASVGKYQNFLTIGLVVTAAVGFLFFAIDRIQMKMKDKWPLQEDFFRILFTVGITGLVEATLNTIILRGAIPELGAIPFLVYWTPRIIVQLLMIVVQTYIVSLLLSIYKRNIKAS